MFDNNEIEESLYLTFISESNQKRFALLSEINFKYKFRHLLKKKKLYCNGLEINILLNQKDLNIT